MSLVKKFLTAVCSLTMAVTAISALSATAFADEVPTLTGDITVNEAAKTADISIYVKDIPSTVYSSSNTFITSMTLPVTIEGYTSIDCSNEDNIWNFLDAGNATSNAGGASIEPGSLASTGKKSITLTLTAAPIANGITLSGETAQLMTIKGLPLTDDAVKNGFTVDIAGNDDAKGSQIIVKRRSSVVAEWKGNTTFDSLKVVDPSWKPEPVDPKPDYVYDDKDPSATNWKAADTDVAPSVYEGTDGSKAVGAKATVNPGSDKNTYTGLVWKVKSADGAKTYTYTQGVNITGAADFVYGIVINDATESDVDLNSFGVAVK